MTITVRLPDEIEAKLRAKLGVQQVDPQDTELLEFIRQAIAEKLARDRVVEPAAEEKPSAYERGKHLFGKYSSGITDLSENDEKYLGEILRAKHHR
jgi:predicted transcriptional regulator